jgi:hypothetical protein
MTQPRADQNSRARDRRDGRSIDRERERRSTNRALVEREDQADSGPDRDHPLTRRSREVRRKPDVT